MGNVIDASDRFRWRQVKAVRERAAPERPIPYRRDQVWLQRQISEGKCERFLKDFFGVTDDQDF